VSALSYVFTGRQPLGQTKPGKGDTKGVTSNVRPRSEENRTEI